MSDTPRTDYALIAVDFVRGAPVPYVTADFARQLERELARLTEDFSVLNRENTKAQRELA